MLEELEFPFQAVGSGVSERVHPSLSPSDVVQSLAEKKARAVAETCRDHLVIGADTIVVLKKSILGKPSESHVAQCMLEDLCGEIHCVVTGLAVIDTRTGLYRRSVVSTLVRMRRYSKSEISEYVKTGEPMGKAGSYAIQGLGGALVKGIEGCYNNVVGLPLCEVGSLLSCFGCHLDDRRAACKLPTREICPRYEQVEEFDC